MSVNPSKRRSHLARASTNPRIDILVAPGSTTVSEADTMKNLWTSEISDGIARLEADLKRRQMTLQPDHSKSMRQFAWCSVCGLRRLCDVIEGRPVVCDECKERRS